VGLRIVMVKQPVLVPPSLWMFSADLLPQTLQNLRVVMLVHRLAWRNKFLVNNALRVKKDHQHALRVRPDLIQASKVRVLPVELSPKAVLSISCVSDAVFASLKQNFTQMLCTFKSAISL
jgi:hypothetical protein